MLLNRSVYLAASSVERIAFGPFPPGTILFSLALAASRVAVLAEDEPITISPAFNMVRRFPLANAYWNLSYGDDHADKWFCTGRTGAQLLFFPMDEPVMVPLEFEAEQGGWLCCIFENGNAATDCNLTASLSCLIPKFVEPKLVMRGV